MKKWNEEDHMLWKETVRRRACMGTGAGKKTAAALILSICLAGCGVQEGNALPDDGAVPETAAEDMTEAGADGAGQNTEHDGADGTASEEEGGSADETSGSGIGKESAGDARVDFAALKEENPEIFAWLYVPGTEIDAPVLQSMQGDDYYGNHNAYGEEDADGAVYIELANVADMCDFNTVLHGRAGTDGTGPFGDLYRFADPDFFKEHEQFYLYLDGNVLTYEIFAAYERDNTSLLREYDFTYYIGCKQFLDDLYGTRDLSMNLREGWDGLTPYQFLVTLTAQKEEADDKQFVVVAVLTADAAGSVSRIVAE